jgi:hypothetical protein
MASAHSLQGLMKWLARDEWRDRFAEVYDAHLQPACERSGVDIDEIVSILGQDFFMTTVWGSAFEEFSRETSTMAAISSKIISNAEAGRRAHRRGLT